VLAGIGALADPMVSDAAAWVATIAEPDGGVPFVLPTAAASPHAPFLTMPPAGGGSFLTFALAGALWEAGSDEPWLTRATDWCWAKLEGPDELDAHGLKCALDFLDRVPDQARAKAAIERLRPKLRTDGSIPVRGGTEDERLTPLTLSERPGGAAAPSSARTKSRPTSTYWSGDSKTTAAGRLTGSAGHQGNPWSRAGS